MLYIVIIESLVQIIEIIFMIFNRMLNSGMTVIAVSLVVSLLTHPFYMMAEKWRKVKWDDRARLVPKLWLRTWVFQIFRFCKANRFSIKNPGTPDARSRYGTGLIFSYCDGTDKLRFSHRVYRTTTSRTQRIHKMQRMA
jgi:hypothetical protein